MEIKKGYYAVVEGLTSMACYGGKERIKQIITRYNEQTGKPIKLGKIDTGLFNLKTGRLYKSKLMYYVCSIVDSSGNIIKQYD